MGVTGAPPSLFKPLRKLELPALKSFAHCFDSSSWRGSIWVFGVFFIGVGGETVPPSLPLRAVFLEAFATADGCCSIFCQRFVRRELELRMKLLPLPFSSRYIFEIATADRCCSVFCWRFFAGDGWICGAGCLGG